MIYGAVEYATSPYGGLLIEESSIFSSSSREPVILVELDQDQCTLTYGTGDCNAVLGTTRDHKCFNTYATCQDLENYTAGTLTLRFCKPQAEIPWSWGAIPSLESVQTTPTQINPGVSDKNRGPLGSRAKVNIKFRDHPHSDFKVDPYRSERIDGTAQDSGTGYNPYDRATFWTKWLVRNPYWLNRAIRIKEGYIDEDPDDMTTRHYLIQEISGPSANSTVTIEAEDILRLADRMNAQAPAKTEGELKEDITDSDSSLILVNWRDESEYPDPSADGEDYYTIRIDDECIRYTGRTVDGDDITLTGLTRGSDNTEADDHNTEERVQWCLRYTNENCWDVIYDLLTEYAGISTDYIPKTDWDDEADVWLQQFTVTSLITESEGVEDLIGEIVQQCQFFIWWDERDQEIKLKALRPMTETPTEINEYQHIKAGSWSFKNDMDQRISQVWVFYQQYDPTESLDESSNYQKLRIWIDTDSESDNKYGKKQIKKIYSRWIETGAQAMNVAVRTLMRYIEGAKYLKLRLDAKDRNIWTGDVIDVSLWSIINAVGQAQAERYQVISAEEVKPGETIEYNLLNYEEIMGSKFAFWMEETADTYANTALEDRSPGAWYADSDGKMPDGTEGYVYI